MGFRFIFCFSKFLLFCCCSCRCNESAYDKGLQSENFLNRAWAVGSPLVLLIPPPHYTAVRYELWSAAGPKARPLLPFARRHFDLIRVVSTQWWIRVTFTLGPIMCISSLDFVLFQYRLLALSLGGCIM